MKKFKALIKVEGSFWMELNSESLNDAWTESKELLESVEIEDLKDGVEMRVTYVEEDRKC